MLQDTELKAQFQSLLGEPLPAEPDATDSPVQPASIDLTIGDIYVPGVKRRKSGSLEKPKDWHVLNAGQTAVITTEESITLPSELGAIGFPPTPISNNGILMTNPGHVDPGFIGKLSFTVINMGREPFALRRGNLIVTLVFFKLLAPSAFNYSQRRPSSGGSTAHEMTQDRLDRLAPDMLDVDRRVKEIAKSEEFKTRVISVVVPVLLAAVVALGTIFGPQVSNWRSKFEDVKGLQVQVGYLEQQVKDLQTKLATEAPRGNR